jgi:hypothetical protein
MDTHGKAAPFEGEDKFPYSELNEFSKQIRQSALDLAESLSKIEEKSKEIILLIRTLSRINTTDIRQMDHALNNFRKAFVILTMRNTDNSLFGPGIPDDLLLQILDTYSVFIKNTAALGEKSIALINHSMD